MNKLIPLIAAVGIATAGCTSSSQPSAAGSAEPSDTATSTPGPSGPAGAPFSFDAVSLVIPPEVGTGAVGETVARVDDPGEPYFERAPEHTKVTLRHDGPDSGVEPEIRVYPVEELVAMGRNEELDKLRAILADAGTEPTDDSLPLVPYYNAAPLVSAQFDQLSFAGGSGVRFLTEYAQEAAPVINDGLIYHFQGVTDDERYYIVAVLPLRGDMLADGFAPDASIPPGGVPNPESGLGDPEYYRAVDAALEQAGSQAFTPSLDALDQLIESLKVG